MYVCTPVCSSIQMLIHIWVISSLELLWLRPLWIFMYKSLCSKYLGGKTLFLNLGVTYIKCTNHKCTDWKFLIFMCTCVTPSRLRFRTFSIHRRCPFPVSRLLQRSSLFWLLSLWISFACLGTSYKGNYKVCMHPFVSGFSCSTTVHEIHSCYRAGLQSTHFTSVPCCTV